MSDWNDGPDWRGLDLREHADPASYKPGSLRVADNIVPRTDGRLGVRPGFVGMLAAALSGQVRASFELLTSSGSSLLLAVGGTTDGAIHRLELSGTTTTVLSGSTLFDATAVQFARLGSWVFISGALDGKLYRYDGTTWQAATGLIQPAYTITPSVVNRGILFDPATLSRWRSRWVGSPGNQIADSERNFPSGSSFWTYSTGATPGNVSDGNGEACVELDGNSAPEYVESSAISIPGTVTGFLYGASSSDSLKAWAMALEWSASAEDTGSIFPAGWGQLTAYSNAGGTTAITGGQKRVDHPVLPENQEVRCRALWDGRALSSLNTVRARWQYDYSTGDKGVDINRASLKVFEGKFEVLSTVVIGGDFGTVEVRQGTHPAQDGRVLTNGQWVEYLYASSQNWAASRAVLRLDLPGTVRNALVKVTVSDGTTSVDVATLAVETGTLRYSLDLTKVPSSVLAAITTIRFTFLSDLEISGVTDTTNAMLLRIGGITDAGPLALGKAGYEYCALESSGGLTSPASVGTAAIIPTEELSTGKLIFSAIPQNAGASVTIYRRGGTLGSDRQWRKLAVFTPGGDALGTGWKWTNSTRTFLDFTSDSSIVNADFLYDHAGPPASVRALAVYGRRLALLTDTDLWLSRQETGAAAGLYYDTANDPGAANFREQGVVLRSADAAGLVVGPGTALRLVPFDNRLFAFYSAAVCVLSGQDAANVAYRALETGTGGLLSRRAVCVSGASLVWLSAVGLVELSAGGKFGRFGEEIAGLVGIGGEADADGSMSSPLAASVLWSADGRLFWGLSRSVSSSSACVLVLTGSGWYRWSGFPSSGVILGGQTINARRGFWALGSVGQVYRVDAGTFGDKALSSSTAAAPAVELVSGYHGKGELLQAILWGSMAIQATLATTVVFEAWGDNGLYAGSTYGARAGVLETPQQVRFTRMVRSLRVYWRFTASPTSDLRIRSLGLTTGSHGTL